jgi:hypothetical protein
MIAVLVAATMKLSLYVRLLPMYIERMHRPHKRKSRKKKNSG